MKKSLRYYLTLGCTLLGGLGAVASATYAWFLGNSFNIDSSTGHTASSYYASGDGKTPETAYVINHPIHLYNLAWLQYMGEHNKVDENTGNIEQCYFRVEADLDMTGYTLPPIGTTTYPFVGNFDGNDKVISNLTISNKIATGEITKTPLNIGTSISGVNIVGMFGVVGQYQGNTLAYESSINEIYDFKLSNANIHTQLTSTLVGIAAGYVNGEMSGVGVVNSKVNVINGATPYDSTNLTANISDHTTVGYCTENYKSKIEKSSVEIKNKDTTSADHKKFTKQGSGEDQGWGGSIDMQDMYNQLRTEYNKMGTSSSYSIKPVQYTTSETITYDQQGNEVSRTRTAGSNANITSSTAVNIDSNGNYRYTRTGSDYFYKYDKTNSQTGSITSSVYQMKYSGTNAERYMCLSGYAKRYYQNVNTVTSTGWIMSENGFALLKNNNYLALDSSNNVTSSNDYDDACPLFYDDSTMSIYTYFVESDHSVQYYLNVDFENNFLYVSDEFITAWKVQNNTYICYDDDDNPYGLDYTSGAWRVQALDLSNFYIYNGSSYYLTATRSNNTTANLSRTTSKSTLWKIDSNGYVYCTLSGTNYYLGVSGEQNNATLQCRSDASYKMILEGDTIYHTYRKSGNTYYQYLRYSNNTWGISRTTTYQSIATITLVYQSGGATLNKEDKNIRIEGSTRSSGHDGYFDTGDTFFPLNHTNWVPNEKNTGYVVSGAQYAGNNRGDIRVSGFASNSLDAGSGGITLPRVYTNTTSASNHQITEQEGNAYAKYNDSKTALKKILQSSTSQQQNNYIFGLHFMNAKIGMADKFGHEIYIPEATINGDTYYNYQVPCDCIDFNLKDKGYINFFAGTYYWNSLTDRNNSFFALYDIFRNPNDITKLTNIREISKVYKTTASGHEGYSYVYEYNDNQIDRYSVPFKFVSQGGVRTKVNLDDTPYDENNRTTTSKPSEYSTVAFDTSTIKKEQTRLIQDAAYYFEIPVNDGEYALGSVDGAVGAYLMYLDIGANAEQIERTIFTQKYEIDTDKFEYPNGVAIIETTTSTVSAINSVSVSLDPGFSGESNLSRLGDVVSMTGDKTKFTPRYAGDNITFKGGASPGTDMNITPMETIRETIQRMIYYDYNHALGMAVITTITDVSTVTNGGSPVVSAREITILNENGSQAEDQNVYDNEGYKIEDTTTQIIMDTSGCTTNILSFNYAATDQGEITFVIGIEADPGTGNEIYYTFVGNDIEMNGLTSPLQITVTQLGNTSTYTMIINGTTLTSTGSTTINPLSS